MQAPASPVGWGIGRSPMAITVPELEAWTGALREPWGAAIRWPFSTQSPTRTRGIAGAPTCCRKGIVRNDGKGAAATGRLVDSSFSAGRWIPPWNRHSRRWAVLGGDWCKVTDPCRSGQARLCRRVGRRSGIGPLPGLPVLRDRRHPDAVHRTGGNAQLAAGALVRDDRVHLLGGAEDGVHGAGLYAQGAADARLLVDDRQGLGLFLSGLQGQGVLAEQVGEGQDHGLAPRHAFVDRHLVSGHRLGVGAATRISALPALGLGQHGVDPVGDGIALHPKAGRRIAQE